MQKLQAAFREAGMKVLPHDREPDRGRARPRLDYKITGPASQRIRFMTARASTRSSAGRRKTRSYFPETSSSVFVSTHIDYLLRNLGVQQLVISGIVTDQCVSPPSVMRAISATW